MLLADDDRDLIGLWRTQMRDAPFECEFARHGGEALEMYRQAKAEGRPFDLLVLDQLMPVHVGTVVGRMIREEERDRETPLWLLTGSRDNDLLREADTFGFSRVMLKGGREEVNLKRSIAAELGLNVAVAA